MTLQEMIYRRKSCRSFTNAPVGEDVIRKIRDFPLKPLYPDIRVRWDIVSRAEVRCICPWTTPQLITVYSEEKNGYLENVGFVFQQMDLYLQSLGLGVCWLGMGKLNPKTAQCGDGMKFVIMLSFGDPKGDPLRRDGKGFKRKSLAQISDREDPRLEPARLAPSSVNSQPWYFSHAGDTLHVYCTRKGMGSYLNRIDMGIALAHLYVVNADTFRFFQTENAPTVQGYGYIGSVTV